jgi:poly(hydroxyalkanoate) depolymerase family esterase
MDGPLRKPTPASALSEIPALGANPGGLRMKGYAPAGLKPGAALVVVLHGCGQTAESHERGSGWARLAERGGFVLLYPEQRRRNNPNLCFNWFSPQGRGGEEAHSIREMAAQLVQAHALSSRRVYLVGLSAGGAMAGLVMARYPEMFAAGAIIAGVPVGAANTVMDALKVLHQAPLRPASSWGDEVRRASSWKGPWPRVSIWHGDADETVDPGNADELVKQWTDVHGLGAPTRDHREPGYRHAAWENRDGALVLESFRLLGMGHGEPVAAIERLGARAPFFLEAGISAAASLARSWGLLDGVSGPDPARESPSAAKPASFLRDLAQALGLQRFGR